MLKEYNIKEGQTLADLALQLGGDISYIMVLSRLNNIAVTELLHAGDQIIYDTDLVVNKSVVDYYAKKGIIPATAGDAVQGGVEYWAIERDFVIS